ncbi:GTPase-activating GYP7 protein [Rutstroemia sp. NJR-2017a BVV2]|nr:GTPase-activating GYP7 protein [Rutstroemia sp. NJR-2017a BVV2]
MYSSYLNSFTSKVNSIRQNILQGEADGDTEDDTYLCRVLRTYYTNEKKAPFPPWLPPDPRGPPPAPIVQPVYSPSVGAGYGAAPASASKADFNSLFGGAPARPNTASPPLAGSLRTGRGQSPAARSGSALGGGPPPVQQQPQTLSARDRLKMGRSKGGASAVGGGGGSDGYEQSAGGERPFMAATSPWASNQAEFTGGGYDQSGRGGSAGRMGLQGGGPAGGRRGPGLPSGPRLR